MIKTRKELIDAYIKFFKGKNHAVIQGASLIPENDPSVLFTTAGMHPLVPFLMGRPHPSGKRLVNFQKCVRTGDIEEVGDAFHLTFFEMLGNWSLGDYFKEEAIKWSFEFLTSKKWLGLPAGKLCITVFAGDKDTPKDDKSAEIWHSLGIPKERIFYLPKSDNWWGPAGATGPCGPDTEIFVDTGRKSCSKSCRPGCKCGRYFEVWNDVFMQYNKTKIKAILTDAIHCLIDEEKGVNKELIKELSNSEAKIIIVTNAGRNKIKSYIQDYNFEIFTLLKNPDKTNSEYFRKLLLKYNLKPEEVIYFDHKQENIDSAKKLGINAKLYKDNKQIKEFIENNMYRFSPLKQKNVDTGMGVERTVAMLLGKKSVYETGLFLPIIEHIKKISKLKKLDEKQERAARIIADHTKAATFILGDGVMPSNLDRGYVLRRLIRRAARYGRILGITANFTKDIADIVIEMYKSDYHELSKNAKTIKEEIEKEENRFRDVLEKGLKEFEKVAKGKKISGENAFMLYQSYGFPIEMTKELANEKNISVDEKGFEKKLMEHQEKSRTAAEGMFKSGLADYSEQTTKLHTATHLLGQALREVLGSQVQQRGSNITPERLRFDFNFERKLTDEELSRIEAIVNKKINENLKIERKEMTVEEAKKLGAQAMFSAKYGEKVSVYSIWDYSTEICAGPHAKNTKELGHFKIIREESVAAGIRRIRAILQ